ncbi:MAG: TetR/AcrR family transcriptional regulator [Lachnospiraceae bacterium]|nr:TetR/AcrR family transcriptional regulator [Lachnospiraceae bacterium]
MNDPTLDERYHVAEEAIYDAFLLILREKEIDRITVSDIIKKAGIVRSTFYNHYQNIPELINAIEDKTIHDIFSIMDGFHPKNDAETSKSFYLTICDYTKSNPFLANLFHSTHEDLFFEKMITMFHRYVTQVTQNSCSSKSNRETFSYMVACSIGSTIGVLHKWIAEDFKTPADTIADILTNVFVTGILPFI